jgi:hypothetical protein
VDRAKAGDKDAAKLIAKEMVKPLKSSAVASKHLRTPEIPEHIKRAFDNIAGNVMRRKMDAGQVENKSLDLGKPSRETATSPLQTQEATPVALGSDSSPRTQVIPPTPAPSQPLKKKLEPVWLIYRGERIRISEMPKDLSVLDS